MSNFDYTNVFLSLGSNLGDREANLKSAISELDSEPLVCLESVSGFYETEPLYNTNQPDFVNCVVGLSTDLEPESLLSMCHQVEFHLGRLRRDDKYLPRSIDIDIIFFGERVVRSESLQIPHSRYSERKFVLTPLNDIAPDFVCPDSKRRVREMLQDCPDEARVEVYTRLERI